MERVSLQRFVNEVRDADSSDRPLGTTPPAAASTSDNQAEQRNQGELTAEHFEELLLRAYVIHENIRCTEK